MPWPAGAGDAQEDGEAGEHVGVNRIGSGLPAYCLGEAASPAGIHLDQRQAGLGQLAPEGIK